ncbi:207aa long hypothetical protein [Pyrococcus horikoshii OT3]|uniref:Uncharacterized protein n=1 Tax=Pyrococcus horikoshii (strain ATCC 700860 / DSM 12428 / JCM 9974 / NBRC 100139 / OT-3) TaxID=70601 RepID=O58747_PYRHO|nr:207aa long hypothetical protein [Pyrococcus horikoshii OT3]
MPFPYGVMSCIVIGTTAGILPVTYCIMSRRSSLTLRIHPSFTVGVIAKPLMFIILFPLVVSTERIASMLGSTSYLFIVAMSTGEPMKGTGSWGWVGAFGQMWVAIITSPSKISPFLLMSASFKATAIAVIAPSASDTSPIISGLAPIPPSLPIIPKVGASPPESLPFFPGIIIFMKSVEPFSPVIVFTSTFSIPLSLRNLATFSPVT